MKINRLVIENFKSIERIELIEPNPFTVFVGPNGSGKSNIFEALEFVNSYTRVYPSEAVRLFGGTEKLTNRGNKTAKSFRFDSSFDSFPHTAFISHDFRNKAALESKGIPGARERGQGSPIFVQDGERWRTSATDQFFYRFLRLFVGNRDTLRFPYQDEISLDLAATNLEPVLKRILTSPLLRDEIFEWLELFIPGFKAVEVDDRDELHWFENSSSEYFTKDLISDGTYNILALLTAVYQSDDKPQFLCIEEPENGLHPQVAGELVDFFRIMCEERGHYIWLNTHSQSMASRVRPNEFVVVEKKDGATTTRQFRNEDFNGMRVDEAWLTNALNGGLAW
ncbi:AAA family ATPase [Spirosoma rhododendri]|uniref:AAA family ATPase n=1 Tax=Spirosoma rhododendri TaxID=2728024 RepID=A0A7L5DNI1_9BACT|nr:ATP-binding protein [Spirosoma rhododendri]QJD79966.1 AAA family ATPase [Spirosoma rhododendri]